MAIFNLDDLALLESIKKPRKIANENQLADLRRLAYQGLVSFGSTMSLPDPIAPQFYPTAKLAGNAYNLLSFAKCKLTSLERSKFKQKVRDILKSNVLVSCCA